MSSSKTIHALMATHSVKRDYIEDAVRSFINQTWVDKKLLILNTAEDSEYRDFLRNLVRIHPSVYLLEDKPQYTLGENRNLLLSKVDSGYVMTWDDDDISHPHRMKSQFEHMVNKGKQFSFLTSYCHYFEPMRELFILERLKSIGAVSTGRVGLDELLENTMMGAVQSLGGMQYDHEHMGEDSALNAKILATGDVSFLSGRPHLFTYRFCGKNVWPSRHHKAIVRSSKDISFSIKNDKSLIDYLNCKETITVKDNRFQKLFDI